MPIASVGVLLALGRIGEFGQRLHSFQDPGSVMFKALLRASLLLAPVVAAQAAPPAADLDELHQRQFRYARTMMQLNQLEGFERGPSIDALLEREREAKAKRAEERWRDPGDLRAQSMDAFAEAIERVASDQRAKRTMSRQWRIDEPYPSHWSVSGNEAAAADCARAIEHPLGQPLRIEMNRDGIAWLRVVAPGKGYWAFDTLVSEFDTKLSVYRDCRDLDSAAKQVSDDTVGLGSIVGLDAKTAGQTFLIKLERKGGVGSLAIAKSVLAGSISGRVTRASDGVGVNEAYVYLITSGSGYSWSTYSDSQGYFQIGVYQSGEFYIRAQRSYYSNSSGEVVPTLHPSAACASTNFSSVLFCDDGAIAVAATEESSIQGVDIALASPSTLAGGIVDASSGMPIAGVLVTAVAAEDTSEQHTVRSVETDSSGRYRLSDLPARAWRLEFSHARYARERWDDVACPIASQCAPASGNEVVTEIGQTANANAQLAPLPYFHVRASRSGAPAVDARVTLYSANGAYLGTYYGGSDGLVEVGPLQAGLFRVMVSARRAFSKVLGGSDCATDCGQELWSGQVVSTPEAPVEYAIDLRPYPSLEGQVVREEDGVGIAGANVVAMTSGNDQQSTTTDAQGRYRFDAVIPGVRFLHFQASGRQDELHDDIVCESNQPLVACPPAMPIVFDINSPSNQAVDAALAVSAGLSGRLDSLGGNYGVGSASLVRLNASGQVLSEHTIYASNGGYEFADAPEGTHHWATKTWGFYRQLFPSVNCGTYYTSTYATCALASAEPVTTLAGQVHTGVDFNLLPELSRMARVVDEFSGEPVAGVALDHWGLNGNWIGATVTNAGGWARVMPNNAAGSAAYYAVKLSTDSIGRFIDEVYDNQPCPTGTSVYRGGCSLAAAWTVPVADQGSTPFPTLLIQLRSADPVFASGFE